MICLGKNNYFRFNHPKEAARIKAELPNSRFSIVPDNVYPGKLEWYLVFEVPNAIELNGASIGDNQLL